jgi:hypothetical protein
MTLLMYLFDQIIFNLFVLLFLYYFIIIEFFPKILAHLIFLKKKDVTSQYLLECCLDDF